MYIIQQAFYNEALEVILATYVTYCAPRQPVLVIGFIGQTMKHLSSSIRTWDLVY